MPVSRALLPEKPVSTPLVAVCEKSGECTAVRMGLQAWSHMDDGPTGGCAFKRRPAWSERGCAQEAPWVVCDIGVLGAGAPVITGDAVQVSASQAATALRLDSIDGEGLQRERANTALHLPQQAHDNAGATTCTLQGAEGAWAVRKGTAAP